MLKEMKKTEIVLIPKVKRLELVSQFRSIRLVTCNQSAFIEGRMARDNVVIVGKVFHCLKLKKIGGKYEVGIKLDMNMVEWGFQEEIMTKIGFDKQHGLWSVEVIRPIGVLGKGDPLSLFFLFLFVVDVFSRMISRVMESRSLQGVRISRSGPIISHILFTDDSLFFLKPDGKNCR
ncbi:reverse transcriptase [Gossypium australe]|uniref:Reverse transcriptase n=1 Tax=Gossypium australe TaxID=47621 RepID=A0A5B6VJZ8_9ROSI|nr:reverse transcriptase [Gossypium australe]